MIKGLNFLRSVCLSIGLFSVAALAQQLPEMPVSSYVLMEAGGGQFLVSENADERLPPASLTKLMTAYLTFQALDEGRLTLSTQIPVSRLAYEQPGSRMFIEINSQVPVEDLIQGVIVQSGNDASVALAEYLGGSVDGFAQMMNATAKQLGMNNTHYVNPTGLPDPDHYTTAKDIAILSRQIIHEFPEYYHYYSQTEYTYNDIAQKNRNLLLYRNQNVDGLKTGHTEAAGYCLASSEKRGDLRLIAVVLGGNIEEDRYTASQALLNFGFAQFAEVTALSADKILTQASVYKGAQDQVDIHAAHDVRILIPIADKDKVKASIDLQRVVAPVEKGQELGDITIKVNDKVYANVDAVSAQEVPLAGFFKRQWHGIKLMFAD